MRRIRFCPRPSTRPRRHLVGSSRIRACESAPTLLHTKVSSVVKPDQESALWCHERFAPNLARRVNAAFADFKACSHRTCGLVFSAPKGKAGTKWSDRLGRPGVIASTPPPARDAR